MEFGKSKIGQTATVFMSLLVGSYKKHVGKENPLGGFYGQENWNLFVFITTI